MHTLPRYSFNAGRSLGVACLLGALATSNGACSSKDDNRPTTSEETEAELGALRLSLTARGQSGALYRLRQATFNVFTFNQVPPTPEPPVPFPSPGPRPIPLPGPVPIDFIDDFAEPDELVGERGPDAPPSSSPGREDDVIVIIDPPTRPPVGTAGVSMGGGGSTPPRPPEPPSAGGFGGSSSVGGSSNGGFAGAAVAGSGGGPGEPGQFVDLLLFSEDDPNASTLETDLPSGQYAIQLFDGWFLEKVVEGEAVSVGARLVSDSFQVFDIQTNDETRVSYRFETNGDVVDFGQGRLVVDIEVDEVEGGGGGNDPTGRVIQTHEGTLNTAFPGLEQVFTVALANAGSSLEPLTAYHSIIDSYNTTAAGRDPNAPHCDDELTNGSPSLNGFRIDCPRLEGGQFDNIGSWFPIAAVNRLDLAPENGATCGQQRIVFANNEFIGAGRMFMILEAEVPNPSPECGVAACKPIAEFWETLQEEADPIARGQMLGNAFLFGEPTLLDNGFEPFMNAARLGPEGGQIRTNNFNDFIWTLREFQFQSDLDARPLPTGVGESPNGELWNDLSSLPQGEECRENFLVALEGLLTNEPAAMSFPVADLCEDAESRNDFSQNYPSQLQSGSGEFADRIAEVVAPFGLTANDVAARAQFAGSCMGCHIEASGIGLGQGVAAPFREDFVHISEFTQQCSDGSGFNCFGTSSAMQEVFLPHRNRVVGELLGGPSCGGGVVDPPVDEPPIGVEEPAVDPAIGEAPSSDPPTAGSDGERPVILRTLGGALAGPHAH